MQGTQGWEYCPRQLHRQGRPLPRSGQEEKQLTEKAGLWYSIGVLDIVTDLALTCLPILILRGLKMKKSKKLKLIGSFGAGIM